MLYRDEHGAYKGLEGTYRLEAVKNSVKEFVNEMAHTNGIEMSGRCLSGVTAACITSGAGSICAVT